MEDKDSSKKPKRVTKAHLATINRGKNLRPFGKVTTAIKNNINESTIEGIEHQYSNRKYTFDLINKLSRGNNQGIIDYLPSKPFRSNKIYDKITISSVESFGGTRALRALIQNDFFSDSKTLTEIKNYAAAIFCRTYRSADFSQEIKNLLESNILLQGDGKEFPANTFILAEGAIIDWEL